MFKKICKFVTELMSDKVLTADNVMKAISASLPKDDMVTLVRTELFAVVRATIFRYAIWMNLLFGFVGFVIGCIVMAIVL